MIISNADASAHVPTGKPFPATNYAEILGFLGRWKDFELSYENLLSEYNLEQVDIDTTFHGR